jgi:hypothetical protein
LCNTRETIMDRLGWSAHAPALAVVTADDQVKRILPTSPHVLLDFDGPICSVFAGISGVVVADRLRHVLDDQGIGIDEPTKRTSDPLAVLRNVAVVVGRKRERPDLMKPNPFPIIEALRQLRSPPANAVLIGDSIADLGAAQASGIRCIAYRDDEQRLEQLREADGSVHTMAELLAAH